jgi:predicted RNA methylase
VVVDGEFTDRKRDFEQFFTPPALAARVVKLADVEGKSVLEPSAGHGAIAVECIAQGARSVTMVEKDLACREVVTVATAARATNLCTLAFRPDDFMAWESGATFDRVAMNPPFGRQQDIAHVTRAYGMLSPGGRLVAIMSAGVKWREDNRSKVFRALVEYAHGTIESLPQGSFKSSGTDVHTVLVTMEKAS